MVMFLHAYAVHYILDCGIRALLVPPIRGPAKSTLEGWYLLAPGKWGVSFMSVGVVVRTLPPAFCSRSPLENSVW